ncbi:MAG: UDP-2,3-diacylglucosamine diphosphatase [Candidatus Adiutrix sp.]|nr:UDP-2,3-diacylglucosamine diphosphatase [Candidatus Adiutrix sp.]
MGWGAKETKTEHFEALRSFFVSRLSEDFRPVGNTRAMEAGPKIEGNGTAIKVRTIFLSDMHLGTRSCRADLILSFLKQYEAETLYLIGDIIDGWRLKNSWYWPELHEEVLRTIMSKAGTGSRVVYIPGNHDDFLRLSGTQKPVRVEVTDTAIHTTADGKRFLVMHGDQFDKVICNIPWLAHVGDVAYDALTAFNLAYNKITESLGFEYRSIAALAKMSVKRVVNFIGKFEDALLATGRDNDVDGVICGHIHHAAIRNIENMCYINTGDWVENCTAIVENTSGALELIRHRTAYSARRKLLSMPKSEPVLGESF